LASNVKTEPRNMHNMLKQNLCDVANYKNMLRPAVRGRLQTTVSDGCKKYVIIADISVTVKIFISLFIVPKLLKKTTSDGKRQSPMSANIGLRQPLQQAHKTYVTVKTTHQPNIWNNNLHLVQVERGKKLPTMISDAVLGLECCQFGVTAEVAQIILYVK